MLAEHKYVTLNEESPRHADISILGTCALEVTIVEDQHTFKAEFDEISFRCSGKETGIVCKHRAGNQTNEVEWQLKLDSQNAADLEHCMEEIETEFETLMRAL